MHQPGAKGGAWPSRLTRRVRRWIYYFKRELNTRKIKLTVPVLVDPVVGFLFRSRYFRRMVTNYLYQQYRMRAAARRLRLIERTFGVKYSPTNLFPPDVFLNDYGERPDFLPKENDVVIDIGANLGDWSAIVGGYYKAKVIAVEPGKKPFAALLNNIRLNGLQKRITPVNCALSNKETKLLISIDEASGYASPKNKSQGLVMKVPAKTLDSLVKECNPPKVDLVKIDTEGFEGQIIRGSSQTISRFKPKIIVEVHSEELRKEVLKNLVRKGYQLVHEKMNFYEPHQTLVSVLYLASA